MTPEECAADHSPGVHSDAMAIDPAWVAEDPQAVDGRAVAGGLHLGSDGVLSAVKVAWDANGDVVHVVAARRFAGGPTMLHAASLKPWGAVLPWAWAQAGVADTYGPHGLALMPVPVADPAASLEALDGRMRSDRLKVSRILVDWFVDLARDPAGAGLMLATAYALTASREATASNPWAAAWNRPPRSIYNIV